MVAVCITLAGCSNNTTPTGGMVSTSVVEELNEKSTPEEPDPSGAVKAIYAQESMAEAITEAMDPAWLGEIIANPEFKAKELYAKHSHPNGGLADVIIAKPHEGDEENMVSWLYRYQERRISEFENYDILDAHTIAKNALVYEQGGYVILLMLSDNESAQDIIDQHIPQ